MRFVFQKVCFNQVGINSILAIILAAISFWCLMIFDTVTLNFYWLHQVFAFICAAFLFPAILIFHWLDIIDPFWLMVGFTFDCVFFGFVIERLAYYVRLYKERRSKETII